MAKAISYSLHLVRKRGSPEKALREPNKLQKFASKPGRGHEMTLYWKKPAPAPDEPNWLQALKREFQGPQGKFAGPALSCVIFFRSDNRLFALSFGGGHFLLDEARMEPDFGLLACIGSMSTNALRAVDRRRLEVGPINMSTQASLDLTVGEMDLLDSLDLVKRLKGRIDAEVGLGKKFKLGRTIQGAQALKFSTAAPLSDMPAIAKEALASYRNNRHPGLREAVRVLRPVSDATTLRTLDDKLAGDTLSAKPTATLLLSPPNVFDESLVEHYKITGFYHSQEYTDFPDWDQYRAALGGTDPQIKKMRDKHFIAAYKGVDDLYRRWHVWNCISVEYTLEDQRFVFDDGSWYSVKKARYDADLKIFKEAVAATALPPWNNKEEKDYLRDEIGKGLGWTVLDRTYAIVGEGSRFEPIDPKTKTLYHLKRRDCGPSGLSHLFRQAVSGTQFAISDPKVLAGDQRENRKKGRRLQNHKPSRMECSNRHHDEGR